MSDFTASGPPTRVGWIGTGEMGMPMCRRLLENGVSVTVWNRTRSKTAPLAACGANVAQAVTALEADIVFITVTGSADVIEVVTGPHGLLSAGSPPSVIVNCSTVPEQASASLRAAAWQRNVEFLAAPISASSSMVASGEAAIVASGPHSAFEQARPYLGLIAQTVVYAGPGEAAILLKLCSNVLMGTFTQLLYEVAALAGKGGVQGSAFFDFVNGSPIGSTYSEFKGRQFADGATRLEPHVRQLMQRDFDSCLGVARALAAPVPLSELAREFI
jgi:3-hydroxyisobutyrate dehydrogenase-like beta-hydroxyacid dehydrogenase